MLSRTTPQLRPSILYRWDTKAKTCAYNCRHNSAIIVGANRHLSLSDSSHIFHLFNVNNRKTRPFFAVETNHSKQVCGQFWRALLPFLSHCANLEEALPWGIDEQSDQQDPVHEISISKDYDVLICFPVQYVGYLLYNRVRTSSVSTILYRNPKTCFV